jgi:hypothetical protein
MPCMYVSLTSGGVWSRYMPVKVRQLCGAPLGALHCTTMRCPSCFGGRNMSPISSTEVSAQSFAVTSTIARPKAHLSTILLDGSMRSEATAQLLGRLRKVRNMATVVKVRSTSFKTLEERSDRSPKPPSVESSQHPIRCVPHVSARLLVRCLLASCPSI